MPNCCGKCWTGFKAWLKAFTPLETLLTIIEGLFLILLIAFVVFLILHFVACGRGEYKDATFLNITSVSPVHTIPMHSTTKAIDSTTTTKAMDDTTKVKTRPSCTYTREITQTPATETMKNSVFMTTDATQAPNDYVVDDFSSEMSPSDLSDGVLADGDEREVVLALVKVKPSGLTFGCILTVVAQHWVVTAASCIDSIEEVDSLDNFVILDDYGEARKGRSHTITDVRVHPLYTGGNSSYDLALLKTDDFLKSQPATLPSLLEYYKVPIGESAHLLGFGNFRSIDHSSTGQRVHAATVHVLPSKQCEVVKMEERHLVPAEQQLYPGCSLAPMCLGVLYARGTPCNYCAGAPLLRGRTLFGVMADNGQCGAACEPARYANMAVVREWLHSIVD